MKKTFIKAIERFEKAVREHEMMGIQPIEEHKKIQQAYHRTHNQLIYHFEKLNDPNSKSSPR